MLFRSPPQPSPLIVSTETAIRGDGWGGDPQGNGSRYDGDENKLNREFKKERKTKITI